MSLIKTKDGWKVVDRFGVVVKDFIKSKTEAMKVCRDAAIEYRNA